ncbi:phosphoribosyl-AMP cyclohydrolase [Marinomonas mediterranea]|uniref:Phosphoribosyl-AMP cyclohydrolase n=1 Tax=Marinomonas mediterranea (strain ATCC 700492 / JCM 21426 / NBRC 103028 / MMB-1) TaxID=717774 RepID=F2K267_MARM1|nr:phosphoribosyl-AMP cyclohydrolase [Marinomonas mediterranea]ADZ91145.1 Phosphoribosyl-AMP cyclohydrolase [Marinomonas mediterranea MMB-1]WCN09121.1 phosphoribosyl-AMP cyclohydrolase [Marinomonas mediterranea]WCN13200.1 phosphoribosyl-AMP cyclohydrolase [Marinomonas mediterranea]WCN17276.1 phosphoribosyl-AMP cyclohydrolase [Marinomonas mediterranea MMB-1]
MSLKEFEDLEKGSALELKTVLKNLKTDEHGLVAAIAQQYDTKEVLMLAYMNEKSILESLETGQVCYWSRSRQTYWRKGESSGHRQRLVGMSFDCDGDAILLQVDQLGPACHTNRRDCFFFEVDGDKVVIKSAPL